MTRLRVVRICDTGEATVGVLLFCGSFHCFTLEDTGLRTGARSFRIPEGTYKLVRCNSAKFGETFTVIGVPGHDLLRVHWGNSADDTEGCVLIGHALNMAESQKPLILHSKAAFTMFMDAMAGIDECPIVFESLK